MRILGIDPGLATIGLGLIEAKNSNDMQAVEWLTIQTKARLPIAERLQEIHKDLSKYLDATKPQLVAIEKLFFETNVRTAMDVSQARGVIMLAAAERGIPIVEATPLQLKLAITGDGQADKEQVQMMLLHLLKLTQIPKPDDAADALALAVYGALHQQFPLPQGEGRVRGKK